MPAPRPRGGSFVGTCVDSLPCVEVSDRAGNLTDRRIETASGRSRDGHASTYGQDKMRAPPQAAHAGAPLSQKPQAGFRLATLMHRTPAVGTRVRATFSLGVRSSGAVVVGRSRWEGWAQLRKR